MSEEFQRSVMLSSIHMDAFPINRAALASSMEWFLAEHNLWSFQSTRELEQTFLHGNFPAHIKAEYIALVQSVRVDQNFTHSVQEIINAEMLPFFKGEQTFEDCLARLQSKLTIYAGE